MGATGSVAACWAKRSYRVEIPSLEQKLVWVPFYPSPEAGHFSRGHVPNSAGRTKCSKRASGANIQALCMAATEAKLSGNNDWIRLPGWEKQLLDGSLLPPCQSPEASSAIWSQGRSSPLQLPGGALKLCQSCPAFFRMCQSMSGPPASFPPLESKARHALPLTAASQHHSSPRDPKHKCIRTTCKSALHHMGATHRKRLMHMTMPIRGEVLANSK